MIAQTEIQANSGSARQVREGKYPLPRHELEIPLKFNGLD